MPVRKQLAPSRTDTTDTTQDAAGKPARRAGERDLNGDKLTSESGAAERPKAGQLNGNIGIVGRNISRVRL